MSAPLYLCLHLRDFAAQTLIRLRSGMHQRPVVILHGEPPLETVFAMNEPARRMGIAVGMGRLQAESFGGLAVFARVQSEEESAFALLLRCAERFSPKIETVAAPEEHVSGATLILDISNCERLFGDAARIAGVLGKDVAQASLEPRIATSSNAYTAVLAARGLCGTTIIPAGKEAQTLAPLPLGVLELELEQEETFASWGIRTLGGLASLPPKALIARIGQSGYRIQALSLGTYQHLLEPAQPPIDAVLSESIELEHPVELLEPLLFLLSRMLEQVTTRAAEHSLAIASVETRLVLVSAISDSAIPKDHRRVVRPALPECNPSTLLKLIQLDLDLHPPKAPVRALHIQAQPARRPTVQQGLFAPQTPEAGRLGILLARLRKLVGEDRVGAPELLDTHRSDAFRMIPFLPGTNEPVSTGMHASALRMLRPPRAVRMEMQQTRMVMMSFDGRKFPIHEASGPWKASGAWWTHSEWCREEWDVSLGEPEKLLCRVAYDPGARSWYLTGIYD